MENDFFFEPYKGDKYADADNFFNGVDQVEIDGKWGLINTKGEKIAGANN